MTKTVNVAVKELRGSQLGDGKVLTGPLGLGSRFRPGFLLRGKSLLCGAGKVEQWVQMLGGLSQTRQAEPVSLRQN